MMDVSRVIRGMTVKVKKDAGDLGYIHLGGTTFIIEDLVTNVLGANWINSADPAVMTYLARVMNSFGSVDVKHLNDHILYGKIDGKAYLFHANELELLKFDELKGENTMGKIKLFTHTDLDGVGCAILAKLAWENNVDIEFCDTNQINDRVERFMKSDDRHKYTDVYITDLSIIPEHADYIYYILSKATDEQVKFTLLDHHETALWLNNYDFATIVVEDELTGVKESGTSLFYNHLLEKGVLHVGGFLTVFVNMIRRYDTWEWKDNAFDGKEGDLSTLLDYYGIVKFFETMVGRLRSGRAIFAEKEKTILEVKKKERDDYIDDADLRLETVRIGNRNVGFVYASNYVSEVGNTICTRHPEIDYIVIINMEEGVYSFRTVKDDVNVADIAKKIGGGGHKAAAGCPIKQQVIDYNVLALKSALMGITE